MDLKIKILGVARTDEGKNRFVIRINDKETTSILLTDDEVTTGELALAALNKQLKAKIYVGLEFITTIV